MMKGKMASKVIRLSYGQLLFHPLSAILLSFLMGKITRYALKIKRPPSVTSSFGEFSMSGYDDFGGITSVNISASYTNPSSPENLNHDIHHEAPEQKKRRVLARQERKPFPLPILPEGKTPPRARYTSKCYVSMDEGDGQVADEYNINQAPGIKDHQKPTIGAVSAKKESTNMEQTAGARKPVVAHEPVYQADAVAAALDEMNDAVNLDAPGMGRSKRHWSQNRINVHLHYPTTNEEVVVQECSNMTTTNSTKHASCKCGSNGNKSNITQGNFHEDYDDINYQPAGQHLLLDIRHVDSSFLWDITRLAHAMVRVTEISKLTLLSYHCHELHPPMGVSCLGVLLESHISLHTWPEAGILALDLFTCGSSSLLPLVPNIKELFAIPISAEHSLQGHKERGNSPPPPVMRWLHKKRGFRTPPPSTTISGSASTKDAATSNINTGLAGMPAELGHKSVDLEAYLLGWMGYKEKQLLANVQTKFQHVQIYQASLTAENETYTECVGQSSSSTTNKLLYLDGVMRSSLHGLEAYHETLVQPALFNAHIIRNENTQVNGGLRVAILGGGEGATLREVLKHKDVDHVVMIEQDGELVSLARQYLPEWNDCSFLAQTEGPLNCFDDPRVELHLEDAYTWFVNNYGPIAADKQIKNEKFDVILLDALNPSSMFNLIDAQLVDDFLYALTNAMNKGGDNGVGLLVTQAGKLEPSFTTGPRHDLDKSLYEFASIIEAYISLTTEGGVFVKAEMKTFSEDSHAQLLGPWEFRIVLAAGIKGEVKHARSLSSLWMTDDNAAAHISLQMAKQTVRSKLPSISATMFRYFDEATYMTLQHPSRVDQDNFCDHHETSCAPIPYSQLRRPVVQAQVLSKSHLQLMESVNRNTKPPPRFESILSACEGDAGEQKALISSCRILIGTNQSFSETRGGLKHGDLQSFSLNGTGNAFFHPFADRNYHTWSSTYEAAKFDS